MPRIDRGPFDYRGAYGHSIAADGIAARQLYRRFLQHAQSGNQASFKPDAYFLCGKHDKRVHHHVCPYIVADTLPLLVSICISYFIECFA
jgi:hypothetical protein